MDNPKVYSYLRFSDPKQAAGSSADRQLAYAQGWAEKSGMVLDEALSLRDEGLSAYHQKHITQGALGAFLRAIDAGLIAPGLVLVVEGLDRLSRAEPVLAQAQLAQIINAGITVVTASDGREYNRASLKAQPMDLVYSLLVMIRAHEESDTKSKRVKAAIRRQCLAWQAGTYRGVIRNGKDPKWVRWTGTAFELVPERAEPMRAAIALFLAGHGGYRVMRTLLELGYMGEQLPTTSATFYKALRRPDLIGTKTLSVDGEEWRLEGYYPALISEDDYQRLQAASLGRGKRKGKGEYPGLITGLGILHCGYCGAAVVGQTLLGRNRRADGTPQDGHRRLICSGNSLGIGCDVGGSVSVVPVERALLAFCSDQINLSSLQGGGDQAQASRSAIAGARARLVDLGHQLDKVTAAMISDDGPTPLAFVRKARELEAAVAAARQDEAIAEADLARASRSHLPAIADQWRQLKASALALDYDARMQVRQLVADTFDRIVIYHRGVEPASAGAPAPIDLLIVARRGAARALRIDRKSGEWVAEEPTRAERCPSAGGQPSDDSS
jgi:DNA invertase Pin-like site-specific DNA recombinase